MTCLNDHELLVGRQILSLCGTLFKQASPAPHFEFLTNYMQFWYLSFCPLPPLEIMLKLAFLTADVDLTSFHTEES